MTRKLVAAFVCVLITGCASRLYDVERTTPENRYQVTEDGDPGHKAKYVNRFTVLAPEGQWTSSALSAAGGLRFTGHPDGDIANYVGYLVNFSLRTRNLRDKEQQLRALKTADFQAYIAESMSEKRKFYAGLDLKGNDEGHPVPRKYSMSLMTYRGMNCTVYEHESHISIGSYGGGKPSPGLEQYGISFWCPGFYNGEQAEFGYGAVIGIDNRHATDGIYIDPEALKIDLLKRLQRSLDSLQFNGEFTQVVPAGK